MFGFLGGSFDPIHEGHLHLARQVEKKLGLEGIVFVPTSQNPLKPERTRASGRDRVEMVRLALAEAGEKNWEIYEAEALSPGPSFTIDTVRALTENRGGEWTLILGSEVFATLPRWKIPSHLLKRVSLTVIQRPGEAPADVSRVLAAIPDSNQARVQTLALPMLDFSSTRIRQQLAKLPHRDQDASPVPGLQRAVWQFIKENRLYTVA